MAKPAAWPIRVTGEGEIIVMAPGLPEAPAAVTPRLRECGRVLREADRARKQGA